MKKRNKTAPRRLSSNDLSEVKGALLPRGAMFDLNRREVRQVSDGNLIRSMKVAK
jgi:hypothetical protein